MNRWRTKVYSFPRVGLRTTWSRNFWRVSLNSRVKTESLGEFDFRCQSPINQRTLRGITWIMTGWFWMTGWNISTSVTSFLVNRRITLTRCVTLSHWISSKSWIWDIRFQRRISDWLGYPLWSQISSQVYWSMGPMVDDQRTEIRPIIESPISGQGCPIEMSGIHGNSVELTPWNFPVSENFGNGWKFHTILTHLGWGWSLGLGRTEVVGRTGVVGGLVMTGGLPYYEWIWIE